MSHNKEIKRLVNWLLSEGIVTSQKDLGERLGIVSASYLSQLVNGKSTSVDFINKLSNLDPRINKDWLLNGEGEMLVDTSTVAKRVNNGSKDGIPLIPLEAMAGALTSEQTVLEYECERYVIPVFKGADFLIPVKGSSMYPKYSSGDIVACQRVPMDGLFFQWNKVYVIDTVQGVLIKRIKPGKDEQHLKIVSDNERYDPFDLPLSAIRAVALVIGVIRME